MTTFTIALWKVLDIREDTGDGRTVGFDSYPIPAYWSEDDRTALNKKIIAHYANREIAVPTISQFEHIVRRRMNEAMPYFCQLYESTKIEFDALSTFNLETDRSDSSNGTESQDSTGTSSSSTTSGTRNINSEFPQSMLEGDADYASSGSDVNAATKADGGTTANNVSNSSGTTTGTSRTTGFQGAASDLLTKYRGTFLNIDMMVLDALTDCFMMVWDNGEEMLPEIEMGYGF